MSKELNGAGKDNWWAMEHERGKTLRDNPNAETKVHIDLDYPGASKRPQAFVVDYQIGGAKPVRKEFSQ